MSQVERNPLQRRGCRFRRRQAPCAAAWPTSWARGWLAVGSEARIREPRRPDGASCHSVPSGPTGRPARSRQRYGARTAPGCCRAGWPPTGWPTGFGSSCPPNAATRPSPVSCFTPWAAAAGGRRGGGPGLAFRGGRPRRPPDRRGAGRPGQGRRDPRGAPSRCRCGPTDRGDMRPAGTVAPRFPGTWVRSVAPGSPPSRWSMCGGGHRRPCVGPMLPAGVRYRGARQSGDDDQSGLAEWRLDRAGRMMPHLSPEQLGAEAQAPGSAPDRLSPASAGRSAAHRSCPPPVRRPRPGHRPPTARRAWPRWWHARAGPPQAPERPLA